MYLEELEKLIAKGESENLEFKKQLDNEEKLLKQFVLC